MTRQARRKEESMRILLVEDDVQMNDALSIFFSRAGHVVFQARNAEEAEQCGAFMEDALSEEEAADASQDVISC